MHICGDGSQLEVRIFSDLLDAVDHAGAVLDGALAVAHEVAQLALVALGNKAGAQQAVLEQLRQPVRIFGSVLRPGTCLACWALTSQTRTWPSKNISHYRILE
jgi:hypothetical protein